MDNQEDPIVEEVTEGEVVESPEESSNQATVSLSLENLIKGHLGTIERLQKEMSEQREMIDNVLTSDATYQEHVEKAKEASKVKSNTLHEIMKRPDMVNVANKLKGARAEMADQQTTLSDLLQEFQRVSGMSEIENEKGEILQIVFNAKLVKSSSR